MSTTRSPDLRLRASADGWRGVIGESFSPDAAATLAARIVAALADSDGPPAVLVTYDGRLTGEQSAVAVASAVRGAGAGRVVVVPHLPTPSATRAVQRGAVDLALLITASHNAARYNGVKVKVAPGCPLPAALEHRIEESYARAGLAAPPSGAHGAPVTTEPAGAWIDEHHAHALRAARHRAPALTVIVDGLGGIAGAAMARLGEAMGWTVSGLGCTPDPTFGGLVPDPSRPDARARAAGAVRDGGADLGVVLDGDGDRLYLIDRRGRTVHPHELLALLLEHRPRGPLDRAAGVAVTASTGTAVRLVAERLGRAVLERPVGFKHLSPLLRTGEADIAGGAVGDLAVRDLGWDRDPFGAVVLVGDLLTTTGAALDDLLDDLRTRTGALNWFETKLSGRADLDTLRAAGHEALERTGRAASLLWISTVDGVKFWLGNGEWLLLRGSSTEEGVRVYGELRDPDRAGTGSWQPGAASLIRAVQDGLTRPRVGAARVHLTEGKTVD